MTNLISSEALLNTQQAAEYLGLSSSTLAKSRVTGAYNIPYSKIGKAVRYRKTDLDAFISSNLMNTTSDYRR